MSQAVRCTPLRQSCDRCHHQKLRCARRNNGSTEACERCLRRHVSCIYSSSLPKGRPSIYPTKSNNDKLSAKEGLNANSTSIPTLVSPPGDGALSEGTHQQTTRTGPESYSVGSCTPLARDDPDPSELEMDSDGWIIQADTEIAQAA